MTAGTLYDETITRGMGKLLSVQTAANVAYLSFTLPTNYYAFVFEIDGARCSVDVSALNMRVSHDGSTWTTASYYYGMTSMFSGYAPVVAHYPNQTMGGVWLSQFYMMHGQPLGNGASGRIVLFNGHAASALRHVIWETLAWHASYYSTKNYGGGSSNISLASIKSVLFFFTSGNIAAGVIRMYGMRNL